MLRLETEPTEGSLVGERRRQWLVNLRGHDRTKAYAEERTGLCLSFECCCPTRNTGASYSAWALACALLVAMGLLGISTYSLFRVQAMLDEPPSPPPASPSIL